MRDAIAALKRRLSVDENPYFSALADGSFTREDFVETQAQFLFAVVFFSRPMAVLASRLPRPEQRLSILHNVDEEHGEGNLSLSHEATFLRFLDRMGVTPEALDAQALWPEVRAFNTVLTGVCAFDDVLTGVATLGIIEDLFSGISTRIGKGVVARGWLSAADLVHYKTHEALDVKHADDFYAILAPFWAASPRARYQITQGLELGASVFLGMYRGLWDARARRWPREVRGPHSLAEGWWVDPSVPTK